MTKRNRVINDSMKVNPTSEWKQFSMQTEAYAYRSGWKGVWDSLVSAISRKGRRVELVPATISFWAKSNQEINVNFAQTQVEVKG